MKEKQPETQDFYYKVDPAYRVVPANSILTTITPDGQIKIDFLIESLAIPERLTFEAGDASLLSAPVASEPAPRMQRHVQSGVLVTVDEAETISKLLKQLVDKLRATQAESKKS